jgi:hypothetical protein
MGEILTASEVAARLKENPIPNIRIRTSVRFRKADVDSWIAGLVESCSADRR